MRKSKKNRKGLWNHILCFIGAILIVITFIYVLNVRDNKGLFGYTARIVVSGSMEPTIKINTVNIIKICDADDIEEGDIICYRYDKDIIHRVISIKEDDDGETIINTQGDANSLPDNIEITDDMIVGKVVCTLNWSRVIVSRFSMEPGKLDGAELIKAVIKYLIIFAISLYVAKKMILLLSLTIKAFVKKENYIEGINELDAKLLELSKATNNDIEFHKVEVKKTRRTRFHYIVNKILKARSDFLVKSLIDDIDDFNKDIDTLIKFDKLIKKLDGEVIEENETTESTSEKKEKHKEQTAEHNKGSLTDCSKREELQDITKQLHEITARIETMNSKTESKGDNPTDEI